MSKTKTAEGHVSVADISAKLRDEVKEVDGKLNIDGEQYYVHGNNEGLSRQTLDHVENYTGRYAAAATLAIGSAAHDLIVNGASESGVVEGAAEIGHKSLEVVYKKEHSFTPPGGEARTVHGHTTVRVVDKLKEVRAVRKELQSAAAAVWGAPEGNNS